jgi:type III restriction enzyme
MSARVQNHVAGRLSLRPPQAESLAKLKQALDAAPEMLAQDGRDVAAILSTLKAQFPTLEDFEREFPSLCFALATGVGKTRLMGAFVAYLHLAHGINNFFVLAPNLTIYNKLIADFTRNTPKYVFKGIAEFAQQPPLIITGDNYDQTGAAVDDQSMGFAHDVRINIFNISKINSEVRGGKEPRIKRMREVLGDSYFNHLANLSDLVLLMDESHRYRASAGVRSINELKPLFGLEVTATPFVESGKGPVPFRNVVMDYPLARAMEDGFVKEPAVVTQRNFNAKAHTPEEVEKIKLEDGVRLHETTKVELTTYARENGVPMVKPFMLVIARDTTHAGNSGAAGVRCLLRGALCGQGDSGRFQPHWRGRGSDDHAPVGGGKRGRADRDRDSRQHAQGGLGRDQPLHHRAAARGQCPHADRAVHRARPAPALRQAHRRGGGGSLNIVAHDKFQEIIDEANRGDSPIRLKQVILDAPSADDRKVSVQVQPVAAAWLGLADAPALTPGPSATGSGALNAPVFTTEAEKQAARVVMDVIGQYEVRRDLAPTRSALLKPEVQKEILAEVAERLKPLQGELLSGADESVPALNLPDVVAKTTEIVVQQTIDIPRIAVVPTGEVTTGFRPFTLDVSQLHLQPGEREIVGQMLRTNEQFTLAAEIGLKEQRPEDYIVHALVDFDDVDYFTHADLLYDLAGQMVRHLQSYLSEAEAVSVLDRDRRLIAREIHAQMMAHFFEEATEFEVQVSRGFTELKPCNYTATAGQAPRHVRDTVDAVGAIRQMLFGGFTKCLYPLQKFDSDTERRFAVILERDASKWFKPAKGQFQIYYKLGTEQPEYIPDFVAETDSMILMVETKARSDIETPEVQAKAAAAARWCQHASAYAASVGGKPWKYLLVPHDEVNESRRLADYLHFEVKPHSCG